MSFVFFHTVDDFCEREQKRFDHPLELHRLKQKAEYACRRSPESSTLASSATIPNSRALKRTCSQYTSSDSSEESSPEATNIQNLPGNRQNPKRRKFDPNLILSQGNKVVANEPNADQLKTIIITPDKAQMPTCSKYLQESASKSKPFNGKLLADLIEDTDFHVTIAESINNTMTGIGNTSLAQQIDESLPNLLTEYEQSSAYDEIVRQAMFSHFGDECYESLSTPSKESSGDNAADDVDCTMNTPVPIESIRSRLRPRKDDSINVNDAAAQLQVNANANDIEILSDECIRPASMANCQQLPVVDPNVIIVKSDSEETVTTTSTQQMQLQLKYDAASQSFLLVQVDPQTLLNNAHLPALIDSQPFTLSASTFCVDENGALVANTINTMNTDMSFGAGTYDGNRIIIVDSNEVANAGIVTTNAVQAEPPPAEFQPQLQPPSQLQSQSQPSSQLQSQQSQLPDISTPSTEPIQITDPPTISNSELFLQSLPVVSEPKPSTPTQQIKPNVPLSARSLSTPRHKISHVRVLDFTTPARARLSQIVENINESFGLNSSRAMIQTPHNQSIVSLLPSSAPPKLAFSTEDLAANPSMDAIHEESSSSENPFSRDTENDTIVSANSETPKVRKLLRPRTSGRKLAAPKDADVDDDPTKPPKRTAKTKKDKSITDTNDSAEQIMEEPKPIESMQTIEDAKAEWERQKASRGMGAGFEQLLREENSRKQELVKVGSRSKRVKRTKKTSTKATKRKAKRTVKAEVLNSTADTSLNSTACSDQLNSTLALAKMLEDNLRSAKKQTPAKETRLKRSTKKKTPCGKFKIMPSPKVKSASKSKSAKKQPPTKQPNATQIGADRGDAIQTVASAPVAQAMTKPTEAVPSTSTAFTVPAIDVESSNSNVTTKVDLEGAQNLLSMRDVWRTVPDQMDTTNAKPAESVSSSSTIPSASKPIELATQPSCSAIFTDKSVHTLNPAQRMAAMNINTMNMWNTPFKVDMDALMPKTPCINTMMSQLITPSLKTADFILNESTLKNPLFPTPSIPITPGAIITPAKDINSPRTIAHELIYGAMNRPTDYSSSSSYYKPDESDGIDKQIEASRRSSITTSFVCSTDEIDPNDTQETNDTHNDSSSSSSSSTSSSSTSSSSDSDSDSDSSDSSDSNASQISQRSQTSNKSSTTVIEQHVNKSIEQLEEMVCENEIKLHLTTTNELPIAQNILLNEPEGPTIDQLAEREKLAEVRRRVQEKLRENHPKNVERFAKPKPTRKIRSIAEERHACLRAPQTVLSPSKRKATQPKRIVPREMLRVAANHVAGTSEQQNHITKQMISEMVSDNAVVDASDVTTSEVAADAKEAKKPDDVESIDAIRKHLAQTKASAAAKPIDSQKSIAPENNPPTIEAQQLIDVLEQGQTCGKRPQNMAKVIDALPLTKAKRPRAKGKIIRPAQNIISTRAAVIRANRPVDKTSENKVDAIKATEGKIDTAKPAKSKDDTSKPDDNKATAGPSASSGGASKPAVDKSDGADKVDLVKPTANKTKSTYQFDKPIVPEAPRAISPTPFDENLTTPAKRHRQQKYLFGDVSDLETPIKSPPHKKKSPDVTSEAKTITAPLETAAATVKSDVPTVTVPPLTIATLSAHVPPSPSKKLEVSINEADSSNVNDSSSSSSSDDSDSDDSDSDSEEDSCELTFSIDETDKKRFVKHRHPQSGRMARSGSAQSTLSFTKRNIVVDGEKVVLTLSEEIELFTQTGCALKPSKTIAGTKAEAQCTVDLLSYGKPLHTSTPSPNKTAVPKFVVKHKNTSAPIV